MKPLHQLERFGRTWLAAVVLLSFSGAAVYAQKDKEKPQPSHPQQHSAPPQQRSAPPQQHSAPPQQHSAPPQQHSAPPPSGNVVHTPPANNNPGGGRTFGGNPPNAGH